MKLLFDQNLAPRLVKELEDLFPDSIHVQTAGLATATDTAIWQYARNEGFTIVTKDADFGDYSALYGHPPKIIWLKLGNCTTDRIAMYLRARSEQIAAFAIDAELGVLTLFSGP